MVPYNASAFRPAAAPVLDPLVSKCAALRVALPQLTSRDQDFARSLTDAFAKYGRLSEKQVYWVGKLLERAASAEAALQAGVAASSPAQAPQSSPTPVPAHVPPPAPAATQLAPQFSKVMELFARARAAGLEWPKIRLVTASGTKVVLAQYGPQHSKFPLSLVVTNGSPFGSPNRPYFGRISPEGEFVHGSGMKNACAGDVEALLLALGETPAELAKLQGHLTGSCVFCGRQLLTEESVAVGYGPICADKFGLPWGERTVKTVVTLHVEDRDEAPHA